MNTVEPQTELRVRHYLKLRTAPVTTGTWDGQPTSFPPVRRSTSSKSDLGLRHDDCSFLSS